MLIRTALLGSVCALALVTTATADEAPKPAAAPAGTQVADAKPIEKVTVTATRQRRKTDEVPATVSVITDKEIEDNLSTDIKDLVRFEPGVSVRSQPARFTAAGSSTGRDGNSGFNIRGLEGNRVLIQLDGIRVPDAFTFGPQAVGRGDYFELGFIKSVEILRGPASALYGSDGVAGAVSFITKDPDDILDENEPFALNARAGYSSVDDKWSEGFLGAAQTDAGDWQALVAYTRTDGHETDNKGTNDAANTTRTTPNPQDIESNSAFAKLVYAPSDQNRFRLSYEYYDRTGTTEVLSARAIVPSSAPGNVIDLDALDETTRNRVTFDHRYTGEGWLNSAFWAVYYQTAETREFSAEDRYTSADRERDSTYDNSVWGLTAQFESNFLTADIPNSLVYGVDFSTTHQEGLRDGVTPPFGETFPVRPFPNTDYRLIGAFVQDEISLLDGELKLYPALRFDAYELETDKSDPLYLGAPADQSDSHVTPKFGVVWWPTDIVGFFANYAQGFKAPAPSEVNNGFQNDGAFYKSIPNPDLKPETSETWEGGIRVRGTDSAGTRWAASATAFTGEYEDFIEQVQIGGSFSPIDYAIFQYVNLRAVEISGLEARLDANWESGFGIIMAASRSHGDQTDSGAEVPLLSIDPWKFVGGVNYHDPEGFFGGQLIMTSVGAKETNRVAPDACTSPCYLTENYTIFDATAYWNVTDRATVRAGIFNILDEKYWQWADVRGQTDASTTLDAYTSPGRNASVSLSYRF